MKKQTKRILTIIFLCGVLGLGYGLSRHFSHFNRIVLEKFEGKLWELPARVYARPLELYMGMPLVPAALEQELRLMRYLRVDHPVDMDVPGKFLRAGNTFTIFCRPFKFEDGESASEKIQVVLQGGKVELLKNLDSSTFPDMIRPDPVLVGSFYPAHHEDRVLVAKKDVPPLLVKTLLAVEDQGFYKHYGIQPSAVLRALIANIRKRKVVQGASTITQQLAKNFFLSNKKTLRRKIEEMFMALALEWNYEKDQILEAYMNEVNLGQDGKRAIHGFGLASSFYFGKAAKDLRTHEIALLVGLLKGPSLYDPRRNPERAMKRRNIVLEIMKKENLIRTDIAEQAIRASLDVTDDPPKGTTQFPAYLDMVRRQLLQEYREEDLRSAGLRIFTSFDPQVQSAAEKAVSSEISRIENARRLPKGKLQISAVVTSTGGNEVLAVIGGRSPRFKGFNRALDARRPIGSLMKPVVFLTALSHSERYTLISQVDDSYLSVSTETGKKWVPKNYDREYHGNIPLYFALAHSYNVATVRMGMDVGLSNVFETLRNMGFEQDVKPYPAALLGTVEMSSLEVAQMYQTLAAGGFYSPARTIRSVFRPDGASLQRYPLTVRQSLDPGPVYLLNKILQTVVVEGTARSLNKTLPEELGAAGKTGTTNDLKDSWFAGFTGNHLAVVWMGRDDNKSCGLTGSSGALQVWGKIMAGLSNTPLELPLPEEVEWAVIDSETGMRTDKACENAMAVPFLIGSAPTETVSCPEGEKREKTAEETKKSGSAFMRWLKEVFKWEKNTQKEPYQWEEDTRQKGH